MPSKTNIKRGTLTESMLAPHLRDRAKRGNSAMVNTQNSSSYKTYLTGSDVIKNSLLYLADDGRLVSIGDNTTGHHKPVFAIAYESVAINSYVKVYNAGDTITIPNASFEIGEEVYLSGAALPTTTYSYIVGNWYQRLGIAINENSFVLKIESAKKMT